MSIDWNEEFKNFTEFTLCCFCENPYFGRGYSASPVKEGKCCRVCHNALVVPFKMHSYIKSKKWKEDNV